MADSFATYTGDGATNSFSVPYSYLKQSHVKVYIDGVEDTTFTWLTASSVAATSTPGVGETVLVKRETPRGALDTVIPSSGSVPASKHNNQALQALYVAEEAFDALTGVLADTADGTEWDADSKRIVNLADPTGAQHAVTKNYLDTTYTTAINAAQTAAETAQGFAEDAQSAAETAQSAAEDAQAAAELVYDTFDDRYLGAKASDPATDNDGGALAAGALYFNTSTGVMKVYTGSVWTSAYASGLVASNIEFTPAGGIAAVNVQAALEELDTEKLAAASYTAADVLSKLLTVDGDTSGVDADLWKGGDFTVSTGSPSGGSDGDFWFQYTA